MRVTCEQGHEVCSVPDWTGWKLSEESFTDWDSQQIPIVNGESIVRIEQIRCWLRPLREELGMETHLAGMCWCGAPYAGFDERSYFRIHTANGWMPKEEELR